jgi:hypothetical protein
MGIISGREVEVPKEIQSLLENDEKVLHSFEQASITGKIGGAESIYVSNKRVFLLKPTALGLRRNVEDYRYVDMANVYMKKGITRSDIGIKMRFRSDNVSIVHIPKEAAMEIVKTIQAGIEGKLETKEQVSNKSETEITSNSDDILEQIRKLSELKKDGILTEEEFEGKKKQLLEKL